MNQLPAAALGVHILVTPPLVVAIDQPLDEHAGAEAVVHDALVDARGDRAGQGLVLEPRGLTQCTLRSRTEVVQANAHRNRGLLADALTTGVANGESILS